MTTQDPRHLDFKRAYERMFATCARQDEALASSAAEVKRLTYALSIAQSALDRVVAARALTKGTS